MPDRDLAREGDRLMRICNACRYCEGYCAVFPSMERRVGFSPGDLNYLANLCHNCGECLYACQYAPPHEFKVNVPRTLAQIRAQSYEDYAWPAPVASAFRLHGFVTAIAVAAFLSAVLVGGAWLRLGEGLFVVSASGNPYVVVPYALMSGTFSAVAAAVVAALAVGVRRFWNDAGRTVPLRHYPAAIGEALRSALSLEYLHGGSTDTPVPGEQMGTPRRRWFHHLTFYGFVLCFAATTTAAIYHHVFDWPAPYPFSSAPVVLGTIGGLGLLIGPAGLYLLRKRRDPAAVDPAQHGMDDALIALLGLTSGSGLLLLALRSTPAMGTLLITHLAVVLALFLTIPYGKFVHGIYRSAALLKYALENRTPPDHLPSGPLLILDDEGLDPALMPGRSAASGTSSPV
jgi:citrate/tricarballylate utilization protein